MKSSPTKPRSISKQLEQFGYVKSNPITYALQGSIWRATKKSSNAEVVIKITDKSLHTQSIAIVNGKQYEVEEDIKTEALLLEYLTTSKKAPRSIIKYIDFIQSSDQYFLVMEDGKKSCFDFIVHGHNFINQGVIAISEWHKLVKYIFKQMVECIEYLHDRHVAHMDISLENFLINDPQVKVTGNNVKFLYDDKDDPIQIKLCDFGLATFFGKDGNFKSSKHVGKSGYYSPEIAAKKKGFDAKKNDIFSLGVCLFMMIIGSCPWKKATGKDECFRLIMNGQLKQLLTAWKRYHYVNNELMSLFQMIFKYENHRADIEQIKNCEWLKD